LNAGTSADLGLFVVQVKNDPIASSRAVYLDEFRFGTTLQDVTSIPEPATIGMLGLGGILVMLLRRIRYS
ncbi:MAG: PEP-CTERM sorting domain-containing protein, partial [Kiritimatiellales bacterium]